MKVNPLEALDIPASWPKQGKLPDGSLIDLKTAFQTMSFAGLASIVVDVPGRRQMAPWADCAGYDSFKLSPDVDGLLSREELESNGVFDSTLEGWARDQHGIVLDLSKDDVDTRALRWDAYRRFVADTDW